MEVALVLALQHEARLRARTSRCAPTTAPDSSKRRRTNLPNRLELSLLVVLALPSASKTTFVLRIRRGSRRARQTAARELLGGGDGGGEG